MVVHTIRTFDEYTLWARLYSINVIQAQDAEAMREESSMLIELSEKYPGVRFSRFDWDATPQLAKHFHIQYVPVITLVKDAKKVTELDGAATDQAILDSNIQVLIS